MKNLLLISGLCAIAVISGCNKESKNESPAEKATTLETTEQKISYIVGHDIGGRMSTDGFDVDIDSFVLGMKENADGKDSRYSEEEARQMMTEFQATLQEKRQQKEEQEAKENTEKGAAFLAENAKKEGVVQTESGLQYKELVAGEGPVPKATDRVVVHYEGKLLDGTEFDSSYARGEPVEFAVTNLIAGWVEALQIMNVGDKWELYVPSELAYGPGRAGEIPPNSTLIFTMELLEIAKPEEEKTEEAEVEAEAAK